MNEAIRVGVIGANAERGWARDAHVAALAALPQYRLVAVSARSQEIAEAARAAFGAESAYGDSHELIRDPDVDLVVVTVKVPEHRALVLEALTAGKHVYCEWPLGRNLEEAREMAAAVKPDTRVMIGLQGLSAPAIVRAVQLIRDGAIGKPRVLRAFTAAAAWGDETTPFYTYLQDKTTGATLETIGCGHILPAIEALVGAYEEVDARNTTFVPLVPVAGTDDKVARTGADHMLVLGGHASGCVSTLEVVGGVSPRPSLLEITGETGWLRVVGSVPGTYQIPRLELEASFPLDPLPERVAPHLKGAPVNIAEAYAHFARDLEQGTRTVPDFDVAVELTRLLAVIDEASATGQRQTL